MTDVIDQPVVQVMILLFGGAIALANGLILLYLKSSQSERKEDRERLIRIETRLEGLDAMRGDIQSNRHKLSDMDRSITVLAGRITNLEQRVHDSHSRHDHYNHKDD